MRILALECSAKAASAAITENGELLGMYFQNSGLTHSRTLLPMAEDLMKNLGFEAGDMDAIAVSAGPGSFTGVRIGVSTVKGLCWGTEKPCIGVSTLEAMAWNAEGRSEIICCCMDARRNQVYNALFRFENGHPTRLTPDRAISLQDLADEAAASGETYFMVGDGSHIAHRHFEENGLKSVLAPAQIRMQNAFGVCRASEGKEPVSGQELLPVYLRLSQAERERLERINKQNKGETEK